MAAMDLIFSNLQKPRAPLWRHAVFIFHWLSVLYRAEHWPEGVQLHAKAETMSESDNDFPAVVAYGFLCTCDGYLEGTDFLHALEAADSLAYGQLAG